MRFFEISLYHSITLDLFFPQVVNEHSISFLKGAVSKNIHLMLLQMVNIHLMSAIAWKKGAVFLCCFLISWSLFLQNNQHYSPLSKRSQSIKTSTYLKNLLISTTFLTPQIWRSIPTTKRHLAFLPGILLLSGKRRLLLSSVLRMLVWKGELAISLLL